MDLSVIIPVCNMQKSIAACLRSVTRCSKENIDMECIVIDDGSTDETAAVVNRYIERDGRIKLLTKEHKGAADTCNEGIETASGEYVMFLNAKDRLCEDAWEQIEAAVEEEYADFVAFSHITLNKKGKFKARMLPLSDVISTDGQEARRLMYADSACSTCLGKIFKSRIIRDNNIFFRTDLPAGGEYLFATEYFEHCESYLMTKAMILYCPEADSRVIQDSRMEAWLEAAPVLYDFHVGAVQRCHDSELMYDMQVYCFKVLTNYLTGYAKACRQDKESIEHFYKKVLENETVNRILKDVDEHRIRSGILRHEYKLLKDKNAVKLRKYFMLKSWVR